MGGGGVILMGVIVAWYPMFAGLAWGIWAKLMGRRRRGRRGEEGEGEGEGGADTVAALPVVMAAMSAHGRALLLAGALSISAWIYVEADGTIETSVIIDNPVEQEDSRLLALLSYAPVILGGIAAVTGAALLLLVVRTERGEELSEVLDPNRLQAEVRHVALVRAVERRDIQFTSIQSS